MRTTERLRGLKNWTAATVCKGRKMKAPPPDMDLSKIIRREPGCYLGWAPSRLDDKVQAADDPMRHVCPAILIMPNQAYGKYTEEKRFDRYNNIHRPQEMGQHLTVSNLFCVYEPGIRLPGFVTSVGERGEGMDTSKLLEGTEEGLFTLLGWMDDYMEALIGQKLIPKTDLAVEEDTITYSLYTDQNYVVDRRPLFYGFVNVSFLCYAEEGTNPPYQNLLN